MDHNTIKDYFKYLAKQAGLPDSGLDDHIDDIITMGTHTFCGQGSWSFLQRSHKMTITADDEQDLPDWCQGFSSAREKTTTAGNSINYLPKEEFHDKYPSYEAYSVGNPVEMTVYKDEGVWKAKFLPKVTTGVVIYWDLLQASVTPEAVPNTHLDGLLSSIGMHLYKIGTPERMAAMEQHLIILQRVERVDSPFMGDYYRFKDSSDAPRKANRFWV